MGGNYAGTATRRWKGARMPNPRHEYGGCVIELCSYEMRPTSRSPGGWVPHARIWYEDGGTLTSYPLTDLAVESMREQADAVILAQAKARIDSGNLPRRKGRVPRSRGTVAPVSNKPPRAESDRPPPTGVD